MFSCKGVVNCKFSKNGVYGVLRFCKAEQLSYCIVSGVFCRENHTGICISGGHHIIVANNLCHTNKKYGIDITGSSDKSVVNNQCVANGYTNIRITDSLNCSIKGNTCRALASSGFGVFWKNRQVRLFVMMIVLKWQVTWITIYLLEKKDRHK